MVTAEYDVCRPTAVLADLRLLIIGPNPQCTQLKKAKMNTIEFSNSIASLSGSTLL